MHSVELFQADYRPSIQVPFSLFPSSYRNEAVTEEESTRVKVEGETRRGAGREGHEERYSSFSASLPGRRREEVNVYEEDRERRPRRSDNYTAYEEEDRYREDRPRDRVDKVEIEQDRHRDHDRRYKDTRVDIEVDRRDKEIDVSKREYREKNRNPTYDIEIDRYEHREHRERGPKNNYDIEIDRREERVYDDDRHHHHERGLKNNYDIEIDRREERVYDDDRHHQHHSKMGYYDDEGHYHSVRHGLEKAADRVFHPFHPRHEHDREEIIIEKEGRERGPVRYRDGMQETVRYVDRRGPRNTITIPCHHIRIGDIVILQGRPCQVIRITTSAQTGQHRYLGVDLFTKQLREESSFTSNPAPSVIVQNMLGPVFKTYRVLDIRDDGRVVAMTETGDVRQGLPVIDQDNLWMKLNESFADGRGSVRVMVINDGGRELAVDYKVIHGSRL